jgi:hypothetical protein
MPTCPCCTDVGADGAAQLAKRFTHAVHSTQQADRSNKTSKSSEHAATGAPRLMQVPKHRMHINFANNITLGRMKERYYLIIVLTASILLGLRPAPLALSQRIRHEFITMTGIRISSIRMDGAGEFRKSKLHGVLQSPRYHYQRGASLHAHFQCTCRGRNPHF